MPEHALTNHQPRRQGARLASISAVFGCTLFMLIEILPLFLKEPDGMVIIVAALMIVFSSLFVIPFAAIGGYTLGWIFEKAKWDRKKETKASLSGIVAASLALVNAFLIGGFIQACFGSHGKCEADFWGYMERLIISELRGGLLTDYGRLYMRRFVLALIIAAACGGVTGWCLAKDTSTITLSGESHPILRKP